ncbi:NAD-dependent epimerase/dehydratase family protein [Halotalea alkalilenta]|uniref:NAD-dependent epimerase/dehydratase family protein n=1 Tax=Halotalea alkalilenta TaxID=376489 RepID=UPI0006947778|nr:NAD(P)-dependent oxidoreductase [Halotalea alkalilenta]
MTTFITGSSGFVGLALTEHLLACGEEVIGYDLSMPPDVALRIFARLPGRFVIETGDVRDAKGLHQCMDRHRPDRLITLAAITADVTRERLGPQAIFDVNVGGTLAAVAAAVDCGVERVLQVSSGSVYGESGRYPEPLREATTPLLPEGLYGMSKRAAEEAAQRLAALAGISLVTGRLGTCFGPWEADTGVRDTLSAPFQVLSLARRGAAVIIPRAGKRDWLYVRDAASAIATLLAQSRWRWPIYNIAAGFEWSIEQWCQRIAPRYPGFSWRLAAAGEMANIDYFAHYDRASMDVTRLIADTGFVPRFGLVEAEKDFHAWIARHGVDVFESGVWT